MKSIGELMTKMVVTVDAQSSIVDAVALMREKGIGAIIVMAGENVAGIFTERDVIKRVLAAIGGERYEDLKVKDFMTVNPVTAAVDDSVPKLIDSMRRSNIRHMPVMESGHVAGILSLRDLMWHYVEELERTNENLRQTTVSRDHLDIINKELEIKSHDLEKAYEELKNTSLQLVQSEKLKALGELTAGVAHEMNQPLNNTEIICKSALAKIDKDRYDTEMVIEDMGDILAQIRKISGMVEHMMIFTRYSDGVPEQWVDLSAVADRSLKFVRQDFKDRKIELIEELENGLPMVRGDPIAIEQVIMNLLINARYAVENSGKGERRVIIRAVKIDGQNAVALEVRDTGKGVPEALKGKIFQPFFTTKDPGAGTGLGLSVSNKIVEEHRGKLELESEEGKGATFKMILPAQFPVAPQTTEDKRQKTEFRKQKL